MQVRQGRAQSQCNPWLPGIATLAATLSAILAGTSASSGSGGSSALPGFATTPYRPELVETTSDSRPAPCEMRDAVLPARLNVWHATDNM